MRSFAVLLSMAFYGFLAYRHEAGAVAQEADSLKVAAPRADWTQWGGSNARMNTPVGRNIPTQWNAGEVQVSDRKKGQKPVGSKNIKWAVQLGSEAYGNPVVARGKVFVGTNNGAGYLERYSSDVDLGVLLCFEEATGNFLWQHSNEKLSTGRVHDWPNQGVCSTPVVDGDRLWYVSNRGEIICLDTEGFYDDQDDGLEQPFRLQLSGSELVVQNFVPWKEDADVVWRFDMMRELGVSQHNMATCSMLAVEGVLFACTSNGVDESHVNIPAPQAPSFIAIDQVTGRVLWTDDSPGGNILHAQWASPSYGVFKDQPQVIFPGGDGWLYSFDPKGNGKGGSRLLWKFDANPKSSLHVLGGSATRCHFIGFPAIYDGLVYIATGEDPEHGEGNGHLWCIDPTKRLDGGDVSDELAVDQQGNILAPRRLQAIDLKLGERAIPNPNSAVIWHYIGRDPKEFEETFHRSLSTPVIQDDILYIADFSGLLHCLHAKTGQAFWTFDCFAAVWSSPMLVDGKVYMSDEDGEVAIFRHTAKPQAAHFPFANDEIERERLRQKLIHDGVMISVCNFPSAIYTTPIVANNVLYIATRNALYAIEESDK